MLHWFDHFRALAVLTAVFSGWLLPPGERSVFAQPARPSINRPAVALDVNTEAVKRLATVEDHVKERQWSQAILILQQVAADHGEAMIAVSSRRYLNVATYCNSILANLPPQGLAVYREKHDAQAKQWLETGLATRNRGLLEKIVRQAFVSSSGDEALFWLGEWAWDEGNYAAARDYWRQLLELPDPPEAGLPQHVLRYPDSSISQPLIAARIVLCHIMEGDEELAKSWLDYLSKQYPEARGDLAGRSGSYSEILAEVLKESRTWRFPDPQSDMPTFAGNPERNHRHPKALEVGGVQWERPLPEHHFDPDSPERRSEPSLSYFPQVAGNTIYFCDPLRIYALDLFTGQPRWPRSEENPDEPAGLAAAVIYESPLKISAPQGFRVGTPRFTLTVHENRLYARMGSPITGPIATGTASAENHLVCLDLAKEGKVVWTARPGDVLAGRNLEAKRQWAFEGAPAVEGGRVFVAMRQSHPQTEAMLACLDAETGRPLWSRRVASALAGIAEQQNFISHLLVTLGENMVFYMPEFGVVTALDAFDGRLLWAVTYPAFPAKKSQILKEPRKQGLTPAVFHQGVLYVAPTDSQSVLAISAKTGVILWEREIPIEREQIRHVLGIVKNRLVLSGNNLWILNAVSGAVEAPAQLPPGSNPEFYGYGRGIIAGDDIFWPMRSRIEIRDLRGQRTKQPEPYPGGNLAMADNLMLVAEPRRLVAYSNFAQAREKQKDLISQNPNAALPRWQLARIEEAAGETLAALKFYEEAIAKATPRDQVAGRPLKALASENRLQLLFRLGNNALADGVPNIAAGHFEAAVRSSESPAVRAEALKLLGAAQVEAKQFPEAVRTFQTILDDANLADLRIKKDSEASFGQFAKDQIAGLIKKHGRDVYADFERSAAEKIAVRLKDQDLQGVEDILKQYPNALVTSETRHQLALLKKDQGDVWSAVLTWQELLKEPASAATRQAVLWELARTLEQQGYLRPAREVWQKLGREFPAARLPTDEGPKTASAFVSHRMQSEAYRRLDRSAPALPLLRRWERPLNPGSKLIIPDGEPPGPALAMVLIDERGLISIDPSTGETRWRKPMNNPVLWAGYGPMQLVLGARNSLSAVVLETGQTLWQISLEEAEAEQNRLQGFRLAGEQILILGEHRLGSYEAATGRAIWNLTAPGTFSSTWLADDDFTLVQTENPLRVLVIETKSGRRLSEHRPPEAWVSPPVPIQSRPPQSLSGPLQIHRGFISAMANRRIHAFGAYDRLADPMWTFQGAASFANSPPRFWSEGESLLMLMDGDTLVRLAPETGETLWFFPLSLSILPDPKQSIVLENESAYAAENKTLTCLDLKEGRVKWKQPLPDADTWVLRKSGPYLLAAPLSSGGAEAQAILFQAGTGEAVQKLNIPAGVVDVVFQPAGTLLATKDKLLGWGTIPSSQSAD